MTPAEIAASLTVDEKVLMFCVATETDWLKAGITGATVKQALVKNLIERNATGLTLTPLGIDVLAAALPLSVKKR